jgi:hypothetical protein
MARHLYIGNDIAAAYTNGVLASGAIDIQKLSATGPTSMGPLDTIATSAQFRIVQGNGTTNIVSPWIYGKDVINWSGKSHVAQVAQIGTVIFAGGSSTAAYDLNFKIINKTNGASPYELKSYTVTIPTGTSHTGASSVGSLINDAVNLDMPHWIKTFAWSTATMTITGYKKGETKANGSIQEEVVLWDLADNSADWSVHTATVDVDATSAASRGFGDGYYVKEMEENHRGIQYGYYNRLELPNTPALVTEVAEPYDMYNISATKDGSSSSQIHGVDNIVEINIAFDSGTASITSAFEGVLNNYLGSAGFASVNL